jgi:hypothetical protein
MAELTKVADLPMTRRRRARLDRRCEIQSQHRADLEAKGAPRREDFGRAALAYVLFLYHANAQSDLAVAARKAVIGELAQVGFDEEQAKVRFSRMSERVRDDRRRWRKSRKRKAEHSATQKVSPGDRE